MGFYFPGGVQADTNLRLFNVRDYGATGDNATDDTTTIQAALTAASVTGGLVYFPAGTYLVNSIGYNVGGVQAGLTVTGSNVRLVGQGRQLSKIVVGSTLGAATNVLVRVNLASDDGVTRLAHFGISDLYLDYTNVSAAYTARAFQAGLAIYSVDHVRVTGVYSYNQADTHIDCANCDDIYVGAGTVVDTMRVGPLVGNGLNLRCSTGAKDAQALGSYTVEGVHVAGVPTDAIYAPGFNSARASVSGCIIKGTSDATSCGINIETAAPGHRDLAVSNNVIEGCAGIGIGIDGDSSVAAATWFRGAAITGNSITNCGTGIYLNDRSLTCTGNVLTAVGQGILIGQDKDRPEGDYTITGNIVQLKFQATTVGIVGSKSVAAGTQYLERVVVADNIVSGEVAPLPPSAALGGAGVVETGTHVYGVANALAPVTNRTGTITGSPTKTLAVDANTNLAVGQYLEVPGAGAAAATLYTMITAISGTTVTMADNSATDVAGAALYAQSIGLASTPGASVTADGAHAITVSNIPVGPYGTTQRVLYRSAAGATALKYLASIADNTSTSYTDNTADASLRGAPLAHATNQSADGIRFTGRCRDIEIRDNLIYALGQNGISLLTGNSAAPGEVTIAGNRLKDNGQKRAGNTAQVGIYMNSTSDQVHLLDNRILDSGGATALWGVYGFTAAQTNLHIRGNRFQGLPSAQTIALNASATGYGQGFGVQTLTDGATVRFDPWLGAEMLWTITANAARTLGATNVNMGGAVGHVIRIIIKNGIGGGTVFTGPITFNAAFHTQAAFGAAIADTKRRTITFEYDGTAWYEINRVDIDL